MNLKELKQWFEEQPEGIKFNYGLSKPFSWRGSYDEVAFSIEQGITSREDILKNIEEALSQEFEGYKGGEYRYSESTTVNFEESPSRWSDGDYITKLLFGSIFL